MVKKALSFLKKGIFKIKDRDSKAVRFIRNKAQRDFQKRKASSKKTKRIIVKARQLGFTTDGGVTMLDKAMSKPYYSGFIIANNTDNVKKIFQEKIKFPFESLHASFRQFFKLVRDNSNEIRFQNVECFDSYVRVGTSARGTTVEDLHVTEAGLIGSDKAQWDELVTGSFQAAQDITLEGTADGLNLFYDKVIKEQNDDDSEWDVYFYGWVWNDLYKTKAPQGTKWIEQYQRYAKMYNLCLDPMDEHGITIDQFFWYYNKVKDLSEKVLTEYPFTIEEAFRGAGNCIFNILFLQKYLEEVKNDPGCDGWFEEGVKFWQKPVAGREYVVGVDPSTGEAQDETAITVLDAVTLEQVAAVAGLFNETEGALIAVRLGYYFNEAIIANENNGLGIAFTHELLRLEYPNVYKRMVKDPTQIRGDKIAKYGFSTNINTRPIMISDMRKYFEAGEVTINDIKTLEQMKTFVRKDNGKIEHEDGKHDDSLFALMIALYVRNYGMQTSTII